MLKYILSLLLLSFNTQERRIENVPPPSLLLMDYDSNYFFVLNYDSIYWTEGEIVYLDGTNVIPDGETNPDKEYKEAVIIWSELYWEEK